MAVNKAFVVKNSLEVSTDLILANSTTRKVGIGSTGPKYTLDVAGGIGATTINVTGIGTIVTFQSTTGIVTNISGTNLNYSGIATANSISIGATQVISSARQLQNIASLDATTTATIEAAIANGPNTFADLTVTGVSTFIGIATFGGGLRVTSGITTLGVTTATDLTLQQLNVSGLSTFAGITTHTASVFGTNLSLSGVGTIPTGNVTNISGTNLFYSGISTLGTVKISSGIITATSGIVTYYGDGRYLQNILSGVGIATVGGTVGTGVTILDFRGAGISTIAVASGIATINITGGGSGSIGIGSTPGDAFVGVITAGNLWYNTNIGRMFIYYQDTDSAQWVDAAPFNVGIITSLTNVSFAPGSAISPSMYFIGDPTTGFFSPTSGQTTFVSIGASVLNINPSGINVTGIVTATSAIVGTGVTLNASGVNVTGVITATAATLTNLSGTNLNYSGIASVGTAITMYGSTGIISATKYYGDGSSLSGIDATRIINGSSNVSVASGSTISATVGGSNIFNVTGIGITMVAGARLDVSSYSETVQTLGSSGSPISGSNALNIGTYSTFIAYVGTSAVTFTLSGAVAGRLSSWTLILIYTNSGSRSVSYSFGTLRYAGGAASVTLSATAVQDILSFFTADAATNTYASVVGLGFAV